MLVIFDQCALVVSLQIAMYSRSSFRCLTGISQATNYRDLLLARIAVLIQVPGFILRYISNMWHNRG